VGIDVHFTEGDWERVERDWTAWWAGELDRPVVILEGLDLPPGENLATVPNLAYETEYSASNFPLDMAVDDVLDQFQVGLEARRFYGDAFPRWWPKFGAGVMAAFLGAETRLMPDTVWFGPFEQMSIEDLHLAFDADNCWWQRVVAFTRRAVERWGDQVCVGHTDLAGGMDVLASLRDTQQLLLDVIDFPDEVDRLAGEITRLWSRYYDELDAIIRTAGRGTTNWAVVWSPGRCCVLQCDFSFMISPQMFERFALPDLVACCEAVDHAVYHLDGEGQIRHLDLLLAVEDLHCIQWIPGDGAPPAEEWLPLLKRIRDGGKLCQIFYCSPEGARTIVRELGGRGFAFYVRERMAEAEAQDYLQVLADEDARH
jgi:5-methyltetrahydrofolate--homocysteine methyltransferase